MVVLFWVIILVLVLSTSGCSSLDGHKSSSLLLLLVLLSYHELLVFVFVSPRFSQMEPELDFISATAKLLRLTVVFSFFICLWYQHQSLSPLP